MPKYETVATESGFELQAMQLNETTEVVPQLWRKYRLLDCEGKILMNISCGVIPGKRHYTIGKVFSTQYGNINFFPRMIEMIRTHIRKENPKADIISVCPTEKMEQYYVRRLGARENHRTGNIHFPENLTNRRRI